MCVCLRASACVCVRLSMYTLRACLLRILLHLGTTHDIIHLWVSVLTWCGARTQRWLCSKNLYVCLLAKKKRVARRALFACRVIGADNSGIVGNDGRHTRHSMWTSFRHSMSGKCKDEPSSKYWIRLALKVSRPTHVSSSYELIHWNLWSNRVRFTTTTLLLNMNVAARTTALRCTFFFYSHIAILRANEKNNANTNFVTTLSGYQPVLFIFFLWNWIFFCKQIAATACDSVAFKQF